MIVIKRGPVPEKLKTGKSKATKKYSAHDVVTALHKMQHGKCCYCERKISDEGHEKAVEHFHPQSIFVNLVNDWANLLLACAQCNGKKSDEFPVVLSTNAKAPKVLYLRRPARKRRLLIDPSDPKDDDPERHLAFVVDDSDAERGLVKPRSNSERGRATIDVTGIYRTCYVQARRRHLYKIMNKYVQLLEAYEDGDEEMVEVWFNSIRQATNAPAPYAALTREFFRVKKIKERFGK